MRNGDKRDSPMGRPHVMTAAERQRRGKLREVTHAGDVLVALERAGNVLAALERAYKRARYEYEQREIRAGIKRLLARWEKETAERARRAGAPLSPA